MRAYNEDSGVTFVGEIEYDERAGAEVISTAQWTWADAALWAV